MAVERTAILGAADIVRFPAMMALCFTLGFHAENIGDWLTGLQTWWRRDR